MAAWLLTSSGSMELPATISVPLIKSRLVISLNSSFCPLNSSKQIRLYGDTAPALTFTARCHISQQGAARWNRSLYKIRRQCRGIRWADRVLSHRPDFALTLSNAPVAQLDRVPGFEPGGREFESLRARQLNQAVTLICSCLFYSIPKTIPKTNGRPADMCRLLCA